MKTVTSVLAVFIISCNSATKEQKAREIVKEHLYKTMHDFKSYELIEFGNLDSLYSSVEQDVNYIYSKNQSDYYIDMLKKCSDKMSIYAGLSFYRTQFDFYRDRSVVASDSATYFINKMTELDSLYKPAFKGWKMNHSFRSKNLSGNTTIGHFRYEFDSAITKITGHKDIGEPDNGDHEDH